MLMSIEETDSFAARAGAVLLQKSLQNSVVFAKSDPGFLQGAVARSAFCTQSKALPGHSLSADTRTNKSNLPFLSSPQHIV